MKRIKKSFALVLIAALLLSSVFVLAGCPYRRYHNCDPEETEIWYLRNIWIDGESRVSNEVYKYILKDGDNGEKKPGEQRLIDDYWHGRVFGDDVTFRFKDDNTFKMTAYGETKSGTFKKKTKLKITNVELEFDDKTKGKGFFQRDYNVYTGVSSYYGSIAIGDITYNIGLKDETNHKIRWEYEIESEKKSLQKAQEQVYEKEYNPNSRDLHYCVGKIVEKDGKYVFEFFYDDVEYEHELRNYPQRENFPAHRYYFYQLDNNWDFNLEQPLIGKLLILRFIPNQSFAYNTPSALGIIYYLP